MLYETEGKEGIEKERQNTESRKTSAVLVEMQKQEPGTNENGDEQSARLAQRGAQKETGDGEGKDAIHPLRESKLATNDMKHECEMK